MVCTHVNEIQSSTDQGPVASSECGEVCHCGLLPSQFNNFPVTVNAGNCVACCHPVVEHIESLVPIGVTRIRVIMSWFSIVLMTVVCLMLFAMAYIIRGDDVYLKSLANSFLSGLLVLTLVLVAPTFGKGGSRFATQILCGAVFGIIASIFLVCILFTDPNTTAREISVALTFNFAVGALVPLVTLAADQALRTYWQMKTLRKRLSTTKIISNRCTVE